MIVLVELATVAIVACLGLAVVLMFVLGCVGIVSGSAFISSCPSCGRWQLYTAAPGEAHACRHCAHPRRYAWMPGLVHHRPR